MTQTVPQMVFKTRVRDESADGPNPFRWADVSSQQLFEGRKVVVFALPGAFTPTCSSTHLPRITGHVRVGLEVIVSMLACVRMPPRGDWGSSFTRFQSYPRTATKAVSRLGPRCHHVVDVKIGGEPPSVCNRTIDDTGFGRWFQLGNT